MGMAEEKEEVGEAAEATGWPSGLHVRARALEKKGTGLPPGRSVLPCPCAVSPDYEVHTVRSLKDLGPEERDAAALGVEDAG